MSDRQKIISRLIADREFRADYIRAKLEVLIPSQLRALRLRQGKKQAELAKLADMKQARISAMETPGRVNFNLETLVRMAATHNLGLMVEFVPFSEMLRWENEYGQDTFNPTKLDDDAEFLQPILRSLPLRRRRHKRRRANNATWSFQIATGSDGNPRYMPSGAQERYQMKLDFEPLPAQGRAARVATISRVGSISNPSPANPAAGGILRYGT